MSAVWRVAQRSCIKSEALETDPFVTPALWVTIETKKVNMADINTLTTGRPAGTEAVALGRLGDKPAEEAPIDLVELLFFAYRDFVSDPDDILQRFGFGRAHHRVLHFVNRHPGMRVTDLLDILRITKQSLGRVLRELVDEGFVDSRAGATDRRQRLLYLTPKGESLIQELLAPQFRRFARALAECGPDGRDMAKRFLVAMIDPEDRPAIEKMAARADRAARAR